MKTLLKVLAVILLLVVCIPFVPPIYKRYTKQLVKSYFDQREWYNNVDHEELSQVKKYCEERGFSTDYYILVDFSKPPGKHRFSQTTYTHFGKI